MNNTPESSSCPRCGAALPPDAPEGLCPRCLAAASLRGETMLTDDGAAPATPPAIEEIAPHFPQLEILSCLGRGGMGVVYKARQKSLNRLVALKLLAPERVHDPRFDQRFAAEAKALAALNHPHIVTVYDFGSVAAASSPPGVSVGVTAAGGKLFYLLMEFVDGVNLRDLLREGKLAPEQALAIVLPICEALQFAHEQGIIHRDIKPENLLLDQNGRVKIADFGVAKMLDTEASEIGVAETQPAGTPQYMAPEQRASPRRADHRADIYSLGVVLYEMLTGELPARPLEAPSRKVQIDVRLDEVVLRALESSPELRFQQVSDLKTRVETIASRGGFTIGLSAEKTDGNDRFVVLNFRSKLAVKVIAFTGLGGLGALGNIPGWERFRGFYGFFGCLGLGALIECLHRKNKRSTPPANASVDTGLQPRFSRAAIAPGWAARWKTFLWLSTITIGAILLFGTFVITPYRATTSAVSPEIPVGSQIYVFKLARSFWAGDIIAYRQVADRPIMLGRVTEAGPANGVLKIERRDWASNSYAPSVIPVGVVIGKVVFNFRESKAGRPAQ